MPPVSNRGADRSSPAPARQYASDAIAKRTTAPAALPGFDILRTLPSLLMSGIHGILFPNLSVLIPTVLPTHPPPADGADPPAYMEARASLSPSRPTDPRLPLREEAPEEAPWYRDNQAHAAVQSAYAYGYPRVALDEDADADMEQGGDTHSRAPPTPAPSPLLTLEEDADDVMDDEAHAADASASASAYQLLPLEEDADADRNDESVESVSSPASPDPQEDWESGGGEEPQTECMICLEALTTKRQIKLKPCGHRFHRTCAIRLMETRCCPGAHKCPVCRQHLDGWSDREYREHHIINAFGSIGEPSVNFFNRLPVCRYQFLRSFQEKNWHDIKIVRYHVIDAEDARASEEFKEDIEEELQKLEKRAKIYDAMFALNGEACMEKTTEEDEVFDFEKELRLFEERKRKALERKLEREQYDGPAKRLRGRNDGS